MLFDAEVWGYIEDYVHIIRPASINDDTRRQEDPLSDAQLEDLRILHEKLLCDRGCYHNMQKHQKRERDFWERMVHEWKGSHSKDYLRRQWNLHFNNFLLVDGRGNPLVQVRWPSIFLCGVSSISPLSQVTARLQRFTKEYAGTEMTPTTLRKVYTSWVHAIGSSDNKAATARNLNHSMSTANKYYNISSALGSAVKVKKMILPFVHLVSRFQC